MKKLLFALILIYLAVCLNGEVYNRDGKKQDVIENIGYVAQLAGYTDQWEEIMKKGPTSLDIAVFLNQCFMICERKDIKIPEDVSSPLLREFDREFMVLDIQNRLRTQDDYLKKTRKLVSWNAEFSFGCENIRGDFPVSQNEIIFYGSPPPSSVVSLSQQIRLSLKAGTEKLGGFCTMKNFGFWGIGKYSSGSAGINFASSDPLQVEEIGLIAGSKKFSLSIGRQYLRLGEYGLSVDHLVSPLESIFFSAISGRQKKIVFDAVIGSRVDSADYYAARAGLDLKRIDVGILGFVSTLKSDYRAQYNLSNDKGAGSDFKIRFWGSHEIGGEYSYYVPQNNKAVHSWISSLDIMRSDFVKLSVMYGNICAIPRQTPALNQLPLEFVDRKYLRYEAESRGPDVFLEILLPYDIVGQYEFLMLDRKSEENKLKRYTVRLKKALFKNSYLIVEDFYTDDSSSAFYNTARAQCVFSF